MESENLHKSKTVRGIIIGIGAVVLILGILRVGIVIGYNKARFAGQFGNNFERNFLGPKGGMGMMFFNNDIPGGHGAVGEIVTIALPQIIIAGSDNLEKTVVVSTSTLIRRFRDDIDPSDLSPGEFVVILGNPNENGQIDAKLIRVMPSPSKEFNGMMSR